MRHSLAPDALMPIAFETTVNREEKQGSASRRSTGKQLRNKLSCILTNENQTENEIDRVKKKQHRSKEPCPLPYRPSYASCSHQSYPLALTYQHYHPIYPSTAIPVCRTMTIGSFSSTGIPSESSAMESIINSNPIAQIIPYTWKHFSPCWPQKKKKEKKKKLMTFSLTTYSKGFYYISPNSMRPLNHPPWCHGLQWSSKFFVLFFLSVCQNAYYIFQRADTNYLFGKWYQLRFKFDRLFDSRRYLHIGSWSGCCCCHALQLDLTLLQCQSRVSSKFREAVGCIQCCQLARCPIDWISIQVSYLISG